MKRISPQEQAMNLLDTTEKSILLQNLEPLNEQSREDLCLAIVAYCRFRVNRTFSNSLLNVIYQSFIELINKRNSI